MTTLLVLIGVLVLVIGGCACVFWAARGGPRWARAVAVTTLAAGDLVRWSGRSDRNSGSSNTGDSDG